MRWDGIGEGGGEGVFFGFDRGCCGESLSLSEGVASHLLSSLYLSLIS